MFTCASCAVLACRKGEDERGDMPKNCPMRRTEEMEAVRRKYHADPAVERFHKTSSLVEAEGYARWPRVREVIEFCKKLGYKKIGVAFCVGLRTEAAAFCDLLRRHGLEPVSVICSAGGMDKRDFGIAREQFVHPENERETICNPIGQAEMLRFAGTEFNVAVGLCVGHDSLFLKHSHVLATVLIAKDRALGHNPAAALYCPHYMSGRLNP